jgi:hypothetical protein
MYDLRIVNKMRKFMDDKRQFSERKEFYQDFNARTGEKMADPQRDPQRGDYSGNSMPKVPIGTPVETPFDKDIEESIFRVDSIAKFREDIIVNLKEHQHNLDVADTRLAIETNKLDSLMRAKEEYSRSNRK